jgi:hypothetical protein
LLEIKAALMPLGTLIPANTFKEILAKNLFRINSNNLISFPIGSQIKLVAPG